MAQGTRGTKARGTRNIQDTRARGAGNLADSEKNLKKKFNSGNELSLNKTTEIRSMIIAVRAVFRENDKYYPQVFLDECL